MLSVRRVILPSAPGLCASMKSCGSPSSSAAVTVIVRWPLGILASNSVESFETSSVERLRLGAARRVERDTGRSNPPSTRSGNSSSARPPARLIALHALVDRPRKRKLGAPRSRCALRTSRPPHGSPPSVDTSGRWSLRPGRRRSARKACRRPQESCQRLPHLWTLPAPRVACCFGDEEIAALVDFCRGRALPVRSAEWQLPRTQASQQGLEPISSILNVLGNVTLLEMPHRTVDGAAGIAIALGSANPALSRPSKESRNAYCHRLISLASIGTGPPSRMPGFGSSSLRSAARR